MNGFLSVLGEPLFSVWKRCDGRLCFSGGFTLSSSGGRPLAHADLGPAGLRLWAMDFAEAQGLFAAGRLRC